MGVYLIFHAIKSHFAKPDYDYLKFNGILNNFDAASYVSKVGEREKALYEELARKYPQQTDLEHFLISNILMTGKQLVIADLAKAEATQHYNEWIGRTKALAHTITTDLNYLSIHSNRKSHKERFNSFFEAKEHQHPLILRSLLGNNICIETFLILDFQLHFFEMLDKRLANDVVWPKVRNRCNKYRPFINRLVVAADPAALRSKLKEALAS